MTAGTAGVASTGTVGVGSPRVAVGVSPVAGGTRVAVDMGGMRVGVVTWTDGEGRGVAGDKAGVDVAGGVDRSLNWQARSRIAIRMVENRRCQRAECMGLPETSYPAAEPDKQQQDNHLASRRISGRLGSFYHVRQRVAKPVRAWRPVLLPADTTGFPSADGATCTCRRLNSTLRGQGRSPGRAPVQQAPPCRLPGWHASPGSGVGHSHAVSR